MKYRFEKPLVQGIIKSRPNRFIMIVKIGNKIIKAHCPSTGRIGNIHFDNIPCLLSKSDNPNRKMAYTVQAISLDKEKSWVGINQTEANRYIEFFLKSGMVPRIAKGNVHRERKLGKSRIDFHLDNSYIEVKTMLTMLDASKYKHIKQRSYPTFNSFDRIVKHFNDLSKSIGKGSKAKVILCYLYDAKPFVPPATDAKNKIIKNAATRAARAGVETWQINLKVDKKGVSLLKYFRLRNF
jgi:sugar fermentation stimulation protein A